MTKGWCWAKDAVHSLWQKGAATLRRLTGWGNPWDKKYAARSWKREKAVRSKISRLFDKSYKSTHQCPFLYGQWKIIERTWRIRYTGEKWRKRGICCGKGKHYSQRTEKEVARLKKLARKTHDVKLRQRYDMIHLFLVYIDSIPISVIDRLCI